MTLEEFKERDDELYVTMEDDGSTDEEFAAAEFNLVKEFCSERDGKLTDEEIAHMRTLYIAPVLAVHPLWKTNINSN